MRPARRRRVVEALQVAYRVSGRRACGAMGFARSSHCYRSVADEQVVLRIRLKELAAVRVRYGDRRLHVLLRREGRQVNHKRIYRLYTQAGLRIRTQRPRRRKSSKPRVGRVKVQGINESWSMDFMSDQLFDGRRIRLLTIVDCHSRESLALEAGFTFKGQHVTE